MQQGNVPKLVSIFTDPETQHVPQTKRYSDRFDEDFPPDPEDGSQRRLGCFIVSVFTLLFWSLVLLLAKG